MPMPNPENHQCPSKQEQIDIARSSQKIVYDIDPNIDLQMSMEDYEKIEAVLEQTTTRNAIKFSKNLYNLRLIIERDKSLQGIWYNEFTDQIEVHGAPPWDRDDTKLLWDERDAINLREYIYDNYHIQYSKQDVEDYALILATQHSFNPVKKYLEQLPAWDGHPRIEKLFVEYLGAEDTEYVHEVSKLLFRAAVKRIYQPGSRFDYMPVLVGRQGLGKSILLTKLSSNSYTDCMVTSTMVFNDNGKWLGQMLRGTWVVEILGLSNIRQSRIKAVKDMISATNDVRRQASTGKVKRVPRQCIFIGTANEISPFIDTPDNRHFLIVKCEGTPSKHSWDLMQDEIDQIWAEAFAWYASNLDAPLVFPEKAAQEAEALRDKAADTINWKDQIWDFLNQKLPENWNDDYDLDMRLTYFRAYNEDDPAFLDSDGNDTRRLRIEVSIPEIWCECLGKDRANLQRGDSLRIARTLTKLGWVRGQKGTNHPVCKCHDLYGQQRMFYRLPQSYSKDK